ncbi:unnamed protein product [Cyprideis torosa]|uniref:Uncharacterized protein n=1 Tax=Cyprideis torosa TaxID=163714 RepID=A0A7R8WC11_9CRUS|nr:unnamed protein product [Cyprideis torosa]CAG0891490.1 unnamed protein product [Cyprideis torosa]
MAGHSLNVSGGAHLSGLSESHPILNDTQYNNPYWGPRRGKGGHYGNMSEEELIQSQKEFHAERINVLRSTERQQPDSEENFDPLCRECLYPVQDARPEELQIYLHAWTLEHADKVFEAPVPNWVDEFC